MALGGWANSPSSWSTFGHDHHAFTLMRPAFLIFAVGILAFDAAAALARLNQDIATAVTLVIYVASGFAATRRDPWIAAIIVAASVAAIDATVGLAIMSALGHQVQGPSSTLEAIEFATIVIALGSLCGLLGYGVRFFFQQSRQRTR